MKSKLPQEVLTYLFNFFDVKTLSRSGRVCKQWNFIANNAPQWQQELQKISEYKNHREPARITLQRIFDLLKKDIDVLSDDAKENLDNARLIFETKELSTKIDESSLFEIASSTPEIAEYILAQKALVANLKLSAYPFYEMAKLDPNIAKLVLSDEELLDLLDENLVASIINDKNYVHLLLTIPNVASKLSPSILDLVVSSHISTLKTLAEEQQVNPVTHEDSTAIYKSSCRIGTPLKINEKHLPSFGK